MNARFFAACIIALIITSLGVAALVNRDAGPIDTRAKVAASIFPVYDIVRTIAGGAVNVTLLLPPGANPHTFEPTPDTIAALEGAPVVYTIGFGVDDWVKSTAGALTDVTTLSSDITLRTSEDGTVDPHYWLTIGNAKTMATLAAQDLSGRFPEHAATFRNNLATYLAALDAADAYIHALLDPLEHHDVITMHDAWYYFADAYNLTVVGTFEPSSGREPTPQDLADLAAKVDEYDIHTLYVDAGESEAAVESFAHDHNLTLVTLDAEGTSGEYDSYINLMLGNAQRISENQ